MFTTESTSDISEVPTLGRKPAVSPLAKDITEHCDQTAERLEDCTLFLDPPEPSRRPHFKLKTCTKPLILHIDDDEDLVDAVSSRLQSNGFRVDYAYDGVPGMHLALLNPADCIVLDYDMPGVKGDEVVNVLKKNSRTSDIPIIVLTAINQKSLRRKLLNLGVDVFMSKPFVYEELHEAIVQLIDPDAGKTASVVAPQ